MDKLTALAAWIAANPKKALLYWAVSLVAAHLL